MSIAYNESDRAIEIYDDLRTQYLIYKGLMVLTVLNALIRMYNRPDEPVSYFQTLWASLGIVAVCCLGFFLMRKSAAEKIKLKQIKKLKIRSFFGRKRCVLVLKNGKERKLKAPESESDLNHLLHLCARVGIKY
ncbi:hypothetical protein [Gaetbulibacter aestuarii]|uniref:Uncharacterized protein n=1 Tax=Gaetbulibacter aestuarii TaxID=1502358 RepID=A0ABW7MVA9_9FLAO